MTHSNDPANDSAPRPRPRAPWGTILGVLGGALLGAAVMRLAIPARPEAPGRATASAPRGAAATATLFQCPMHPTITSDHPASCPICGMKLVAVETHAAPDSSGPVAGLASVTIDPARQQLIGLRTAAVVAGPVAGSWRTVGRIEVDPTRVRRTNVKVDGFVERLFVDYVGQPVRRGQALFALYSPELLSAESEYLLALETRDRLGAAGADHDDGPALVSAARRKLELWDVPAGEIARLESTRQTARTLTFLSPISGVVTAKNVVQGSSLRAGDTPFEITDLGEVWVMADAYEGDLASVRVGMAAALTLGAYPGRTFKGQVAFVDPLLDPATRTAKVHMHFMNHGDELKPGLFGDVVLEGPERTGLRIPEDAVIHTGTRDLVFVALGEGKFVPREVQLGARDAGSVEIRVGLAAGDEVVTRANFLVDSESQMRAALAALSEHRP